MLNEFSRTELLVRRGWDEIGSSSARVAVFGLGGVGLLRG